MAQRYLTPQAPPAADRARFTVSYGWPLWLSVAVMLLCWTSAWAFTEPRVLARVPGHPLTLVLLTFILSFLIAVPPTLGVPLAQRLTIQDGTMTVWRLGRRTLRVDISELLEVVRYIVDRSVPGLKLVVSGGHIIAVSAHARNFSRLSALLHDTLPPEKIVGTW